jgi:hypothetical protein
MRRVIMLDEKLERLRTHQKGIERYRRLLATRLSDLERAYIERRLSEEQASVRALLRETFPDRLFALRPRIEGRTNTLDMAALLHPGDAFDRLEPEPELNADQSKGSRGHFGAQRSGHSFI